jgi:hypothetical protein
MRRAKRPMHSRTMWFAFGVAVLGVVYDNFMYVQNIIDPRFYGILLICIGIIVAVLRFLTTLPLD